jgi:2-(1,2-epoxy-1,2-dihydrophenyl)acetyl-CoA isomerase
MNDGGLNYDLTDGLAVITMDRPERLNALGHDSARQMLDLLDRACADQARALILTGAGRFFSSGGDMTTGLDMDDLGEPLQRLWNPLSEKLMNLPMPIVTALNGPVIGISCAFALLGDIIIADRSAYFLFPFASLAMIPDGGGTWLLSRSVGRHRANSLIMLGERLPAEEAQRWGMVYKVVDDGQAMQHARELAERMAKGPTFAYKCMRETMRASLEGSFTDGLNFEREIIKEIGKSNDLREAFKAFGEKRPPQFVGS